MSEINPPPTLDDDFDHDERTNLSRDKDPASLQIELDRLEITALVLRVAALEGAVKNLADLVRQLIVRLEEREHPTGISPLDPADPASELEK